jgi:hypothetical protein
MVKLKKVSCGCFSFFKSRERPREKPVIIENLNNNIPRENSFEPKVEENLSIEHSLVSTQKVLSPFHNYKSTIVTPSCKTPQTYYFLQQLQGKDCNHDASIKFSENKLRQHSDDHGSSDKFKARNLEKLEIYQKPSENAIFCNIEDIKLEDLEKNQNEFEFQNAFSIRNKETQSIRNKNCDILYEVPEISANSFKIVEITENFNQANDTSIKSSLKAEFIPLNNQKIEDIPYPKPSEIKLPELSIRSPDLGFLDKSLALNEKTLPILEISPIKSLISQDDYSDILAVLNSPHNLSDFHHIPDLFIRTSQKPKQLPHLKPITPHYSKKFVFPTMRKENKMLLDGLKK